MNPFEFHCTAELWQCDGKEKSSEHVNISNIIYVNIIYVLFFIIYNGLLLFISEQSEYTF